MSNSDIITKAREYKEIQAMIKELEAEADALKQAMINEMDFQQIDKLNAGDYTIHWSLYESSRLDGTALKKELPDIAARFMKSTVSTRFQIA